MKDNVEELQEAVQRLHQCRAKFIEAVAVKEMFQDKIVWEGIVFVFDLRGNPKATKAYAWSSPIGGSNKRRYYAVLHIPPIDSPEKAVRAAIVREFKEK